MPPGPLQLLVIGFDKFSLDDSIAAGLADLHAQRLIRLVDVLAIHKDNQGAIWSCETNDLAVGESTLVDNTGSLAGAPLLAIIRLAAAAEYSASDATERDFCGLAPEDILKLTARMPAGSDALLMLVEHSWLLPLRDLLCAQGCTWITHDFLSAETLRGVEAELAMLDADAA